VDAPALGADGFGDIVHFGSQQARALYFDGHGDVEIAGARRLLVGTVMLHTQTPASN
jgi:hypothetical protein